jgi:hypothetical protein
MTVEAAVVMLWGPPNPAMAVSELGEEGDALALGVPP